MFALASECGCAPSLNLFRGPLKGIGASAVAALSASAAKWLSPAPSSGATPAAAPAVQTATAAEHPDAPAPPAPVGPAAASAAPAHEPGPGAVPSRAQYSSPAGPMGAALGRGLWRWGLARAVAIAAPCAAGLRLDGPYAHPDAEAACR